MGKQQVPNTELFQNYNQYQNNSPKSYDGMIAGNKKRGVYSDATEETRGSNIEGMVRDIYSQPIGFKITGEQIAGLNSKLGAASTIVDNITRVKGGLQVNLTWAGRLAIKAAPNLNIPNGSIFQVTPTTLKNGIDVLRITAPNATLYKEPFGVYLNDNTYSRYGVQFFPIFPK